MRTFLLIVISTLFYTASFGQLTDTLKTEKDTIPNPTQYEVYRFNQFQGNVVEPLTVGDHLYVAADNIMYASFFAFFSGAMIAASNYPKMESVKDILTAYGTVSSIVSATLVVRASYHFKQAARKSNLREL